MNDALEITILAVIGVIITVYLMAAWEMDHDIQPRDPYQR